MAASLPSQKHGVRTIRSNQFRFGECFVYFFRGLVVLTASRAATFDECLNPTNAFGGSFTCVGGIPALWALEKHGLIPKDQGCQVK